MHSLKGVKRRNTMILYLLLTVMAIVWVVPILWIILTSFRGEGGAFTIFGQKPIPFITTSNCLPTHSILLVAGS